MAKVYEKAEIIRQEEIAPGIYSMLLSTKVATLAIPGQFISVYSNDEAHLLPRPISICEIFPEREELRIVYRVAGEGTKEFSKYKSGATLKILGPLGNGYNLLNREALIIGGGIGIPPMLLAAKSLEADKNNMDGTLAIVRYYIEKNDYEKAKELLQNNNQTKNSTEYKIKTRLTIQSLPEIISKNNMVFLLRKVYLIN